ncbi:MAG: secretin and TonB N-terminal domain-containing protein, partial [Desulfovibrionales bacterium]|nr:secretin and TonB N-terminal domain-containing protein [Desulfovibrionales bacterium]
MKSVFSVLCLLMAFLGNFLIIQEASGDTAVNSKITHQDKITEIDFWMDEQNFLHVDIKGQGDFSASVELNNNDRLEVLLPQTWVSPTMVRLYRLDDFETPVKSFFLQNTEEGVRLIWIWDRNLPFEIIPGEDMTTFRFAFRQTRAPLQTGQPETAGLVPSTSNQPGFYPGLEHSSAEPRKEYTGAPISIDLQNAEVEHVLRLITSITDHNLILDEDVQGKVSMRLNNVPWDQALDLVLAQRNLAKIQRGNIIRITTISKLQQEIEQVRKAREEEARSRESMRQVEPLIQEFFQVNYSTAEELVPQVENFLSERGRVTFDERTNKLIIRDTQSQIREIRELIRNLDRIERQVLIEARVVYATESFSRDLGSEWGLFYDNKISGALEGMLNINGLNFPGQTGMSIGGSLSRFSGSMFTLDAT